MQWNKLTQIAIGIVVGVCGSLIAQRVLDSHENVNPELERSSGERLADLTERAGGVSAVTDSERQADAVPHDSTSVVNATEVAASHLTERKRPTLKPAKPISEQNREALINAGFGKQRTDYLILRAQELAARSQQDLFERRQKDLPFEFSHQKYVDSPDLDLRKEIGDEEYTRYLKALGRMTGVEVIDVSAGSNAARAGLMPGDEIVTYGGERVYNGRQMDELVERGGAGQVTSIEVKRGGETIWLALPNGPTGMQAKGAVNKTMEVLRDREQAMIDDIIKSGRKWAESQ